MGQHAVKISHFYTNWEAPIGVGSSAKIFQGYDLLNKRMVAIKRIEKEK